MKGRTETMHEIQQKSARFFNVTPSLIPRTLELRIPSCQNCNSGGTHLLHGSKHVDQSVCAQPYKHPSIDESQILIFIKAGDSKYGVRG